MIQGHGLASSSGPMGTSISQGRLSARAFSRIGLNSPGVVRFNTAIYGLHAPGTAYLLDDVPIPLRAVLPTNLPTAAGVLDRIHAAL